MASLPTIQARTIGNRHQMISVLPGCLLCRGFGMDEDGSHVELKSPGIEVVVPCIETRAHDNLESISRFLNMVTIMLSTQHSFHMASV